MPSWLELACAEGRSQELLLGLTLQTGTGVCCCVPIEAGRITHITNSALNLQWRFWKLLLQTHLSMCEWQKYRVIYLSINCNVIQSGAGAGVLDGLDCPCLHQTRELGSWLVPAPSSCFQLVPTPGRTLLAQILTFLLPLWGVWMSPQPPALTGPGSSHSMCSRGEAVVEIPSLSPPSLLLCLKKKKKRRTGQMSASAIKISP